MKFSVAVLFCVLLLEDSEGSTLCREGPTRAVNTTLKTNFNGTYQRKDPCTNREVETSSYLASHELYHHTKDNWSDYTHKCSTIIINFLQTIGNLIRFNHKQNGSFNFYLNTSISQKQDVSGKQESCDSLPTIIIEATDCEIPIDPCGEPSPPPNQEIQPSEDLPTPTPPCGYLNDPRPVTLPPPVYTTPEYPAGPVGGSPLEEGGVPQAAPGIEFSGAFLPSTPTASPEAVSDDPPRDIQPYEPKAKYFKTSLRLTPQTDPENGTVKPRIQYMAANLLPTSAEPQNPLPQPASLQLSPDRPIEPTPPMPEYIPPQQPTLQPYTAQPDSSSPSFDTPVTPSPERFPFPPPQPAPLQSDEPPTPFSPLPPARPEFPTASPPSQSPTTANYEQEISTSKSEPSAPQLLDNVSIPNFRQRMSPEAQTRFDDSLTNQNAPVLPPNADQTVSPPLGVQPPTATPYPSEPTGPQQYQPQPPFYNPLPYNMPPPANDGIFLTTPPPPPQPTPSPDYPDPAPTESDRDVLLNNAEQPSPAIGLPYPDPYVTAAPPLDAGVAQPTVSTPPQQPLADMQPTTQFPSSITRVQQETTTIEQDQSTPAMPGQLPENLPNSYDPRAESQFLANRGPQQYPPTAFPGFPQAQSPEPAPFPDSNGDSLPLRQSMTSEMSEESSQTTTEQNFNQNQGQVVPETTAPIPPQQEPLPLPMTTPMPYPAPLNPDQSPSDTETSSSSPVTAVEYGNSAAPFAQQRFPNVPPNSPTPPPQFLPNPQEVIPQQPALDPRPTPVYRDNPNYPLNAMPNSFVSSDDPTKTAPQPFPDNVRPFQPFPQRPFGPPAADTRDSTAVSQSTETQSDPSAQEPPSGVLGGYPPAEQPIPPVPRPLRLSANGPISSESLTSSTDEYTLRPDQQFPTPPPAPARFQESFPPTAQPSQPPSQPPPPSRPVTTVSQTTITDSQQFTQPPTTPAFPFQSPPPEDTFSAPPEQLPEAPTQPPTPPESLQYQTTPNPSPDYEEPVPPSPPQLPNQPFGLTTPPPAFPQNPTAFPLNQPPQPPLEPPVTGAPNPFTLSQTTTTTTTETEQYTQAPVTPLPPPQSPDQGPTPYPQGPQPTNAERPPNAFPQPLPQTTPPYTEYPPLSASQPPKWNGDLRTEPFVPATTPSPQLSDYQPFDRTAAVPPVPQVSGRDSVEEVQSSFIPPQPAPPVQSFDDPSRGVQQVPDFLPESSVTPPMPPTSEALINAPEMPSGNNLPLPPQATGQPPMDAQLRPLGQPGNVGSPFDPQLQLNSMPAGGPEDPNSAPNGPIEPQQLANEGVPFNPQQPLPGNFDGQTAMNADPQFSPPNAPPPQTTPSYQTTTTEETTQTVVDSNPIPTPPTQTPLPQPPQNLFNNPPPQPPITPPQPLNDFSTPAPPAPPQVQTQTTITETSTYDQNLPQNPDQRPAYPFQAPLPYPNQPNLQPLLRYNAQPDQAPWAPPQTTPLRNGFPGRFDSAPADRPMLAYDRPGQLPDSPNPSPDAPLPPPYNLPPPSLSPPAPNPTPYTNRPSNDMQPPQFPAGQPVPAILDAQPSPPSNTSKSTVIIEEVTTTETPQPSGPRPQPDTQLQLQRPPPYLGPRYPPNPYQQPQLPYDPRFPVNPNYLNSHPDYQRRITTMDQAPPQGLPPTDTQAINAGPGLSPAETLPDPTGQPQPGFSDPQPMPERPEFPQDPLPPPGPTPNLPQEMPANPLFHAMESHLAFPAPGRPYLPPGPSSSLPGPFDRNDQTPIDGPPAPPPTGNFVNPRVDPQLPLPDQTAPSNGPGTSISPSAVLLPLFLHRLLQ